MTASKTFICFNKKYSKFPNIYVDFEKKNKSLHATQVDWTGIYMIFCVDFHTFSTHRGRSTQVSNWVIQQDGWLPGKMGQPGSDSGFM